MDGIEAIEPAYGIPSRWIRPEDRERAELYGYTVIDPLSVMVTHLSEIIRQHAFELVTRQEVLRLIENVKKTSPELVEEAFPGLISYNLFQRVLTALLKEGVPVKDLETGRIYISSQNHGYEVLRESLPAGAEETFINVNDGTCEGITYRDIPAFTVQFHPEACAGPKDTEELFGRFIKMMEKYKEEASCR